MRTLYLASASPRRVELLRQAGFDPKVVPSGAPEGRRAGEAPAAMVLRLARLKAGETAARLTVRGAGSGLVLAADTTVASGKLVLEKPESAAHARAMLARLSGKSHSVHTGVCIMDLGHRRAEAVAFVETTKVVFRSLSAQEIDAYVATGEPLDKAGGYGIQGRAAAFVRRIEGDYCNVVGLPLARVSELLSAWPDSNSAARRRR
jgi:septum formation protein